MTRRTGVFGGSFDPVHRAHVELACRALDQVPCDEVWFLPAARAVHKPDGPSAAAEHRRAMLEIAIRGVDRLAICDLELDHGVPRRSLDSIRELRWRWPDRDWRFILGEDSFAALGSWHRPEELFRLAAPVVAPRPGGTTGRPGEWRGIEVLWLDGEEIDLDSTSLRGALRRGEEPDGIHPEVLGYIRDHGLYREESS